MHISVAPELLQLDPALQEALASVRIDEQMLLFAQDLALRFRRPDVEAACTCPC